MKHKLKPIRMNRLLNSLHQLLQKLLNRTRRPTIPYKIKITRQPIRRLSLYSFIPFTKLSDIQFLQQISIEPLRSQPSPPIILFKTLQTILNKTINQLNILLRQKILNRPLTHNRTRNQYLQPVLKYIKPSLGSL